MASLVQRVIGTLTAVRERRPVVDHVITAVQHYGTVNGTAQAGSVTFFGYLSFFPILALGFFVVGLLSAVYPDLRDSVAREVENLLPGVVGGKQGEIPLDTFEKYAGTVGILGLVGVLYAGLGWLSGMRAALGVMFGRRSDQRPNFFMGKLRDLLTLVVVGITLVISVGLSALLSGFSERIVALLGFDANALGPAFLLWLVVHAAAIAASTLLLVIMFRLLAHPHAPAGTLVRGALLGAVGFELLKALAVYLVAQTHGQPSFQAFGVSLVLVVWINYFSRLVMLAAAWTYTSPGAVEQRRVESVMAPAAALSGPRRGRPAPLPVAAVTATATPGTQERTPRTTRGLVGLGVASLAGLLALLVDVVRRNLKIS